MDEVSSITNGQQPPGDTFVFEGVTTDAAAEEIGEVIETKKRRRVRRTGAPVTGGTT